MCFLSFPGRFSGLREIKSSKEAERTGRPVLEQSTAVTASAAPMPEKGKGKNQYPLEVGLLGFVYVDVVERCKKVHRPVSSVI